MVRGDLDFFRAPAACGVALAQFVECFDKWRDRDAASGYLVWGTDKREFAVILVAVEVGLGQRGG